MPVDTEGNGSTRLGCIDQLARTLHARGEEHLTWTSQIRYSRNHDFLRSVAFLAVLGAAP